MQHKVCKDCTERELHCKSWCEKWKQEKEEADREYEKKRKDDMIHGAFVEMAFARKKRR